MFREDAKVNGMNGKSVERERELCLFLVLSAWVLQWDYRGQDQTATALMWNLLRKVSLELGISIRPDTKHHKTQRSVVIILMTQTWPNPTPRKWSTNLMSAWVILGILLCHQRLWHWGAVETVCSQREGRIHSSQFTSTHNHAERGRRKMDKDKVMLEGTVWDIASASPQEKQSMFSWLVV